LIYYLFNLLVFIILSRNYHIQNNEKILFIKKVEKMILNISLYFIIFSMSIGKYNCLICAGPLFNGYTKGMELATYQDDDDTFVVDKTISKYEWLNKLYIITSREQKIETSIKDYTDYATFKINKKTYNILPLHWHEEKNNYGIIYHIDCYNFIKKKLKHELLFADVCNLLDENTTMLQNIDGYGYGDYLIDEECMFDKVTKEGNDYILETPLENKKNGKRILNCWKDLVDDFTKNPPKNCPAELASNFKLNTKMLGFDNKYYVVKEVERYGDKIWILEK
jgi:hypothetical protein